MSDSAGHAREPLSAEERALGAQLGIEGAPPAPPRSDEAFSAAVGRALVSRAQPWRAPGLLALASVSAAGLVAIVWATAPVQSPSAPGAAADVVASVDAAQLLEDSLEVLDDEYLGIDRLDAAGLLALNDVLDAHARGRVRSSRLP